MSTVKECAEKDCEKAIAYHKWAAVKAQYSGWFLQKNGDVWCPDHIPAWVEDWRKRKAEAENDDWNDDYGHDDSPDQGVHQFDGGNTFF